MTSSSNTDVGLARRIVNAATAGAIIYFAIPPSISSDTRLTSAALAALIAGTTKAQSVVRTAASLYGGTVATQILPNNTSTEGTVATFFVGAAVTHFGLNRLEQVLASPRDPENDSGFWSWGREAPPPPDSQPLTVAQTAAAAARERVGNRQDHHSPTATGARVLQGGRHDHSPHSQPLTVAQATEAARREPVGNRQDHHSPTATGPRVLQGGRHDHSPDSQPLTVAQAAAAARREPVGNR